MAFLNDRVQCWAQYCFCCISLTLELVHSFGSNADICRYIVNTSELIFCQTNVCCAAMFQWMRWFCWSMDVLQSAQAVAYLGFHKGGRNFRWPLVLTQRGGQKLRFPIFSYGEKNVCCQTGAMAQWTPKYATGLKLNPSKTELIRFTESQTPQLCYGWYSVAMAQCPTLNTPLMTFNDVVLEARPWPQGFWPWLGLASRILKNRFSCPWPRRFQPWPQRFWPGKLQLSSRQLLEIMPFSVNGVLT